MESLSELKSRQLKLIDETLSLEVKKSTKNFNRVEFIISRNKKYRT